MAGKIRPLLYGLGELGTSCIDIFLKVYLLLYFNLILGLSPSLTSLAIGLGVLWDALLDPWIGVYSDYYFRRHGHRKLPVYAATVAAAGLFFVMWRIPHISEFLTFVLLFVVSSLLNSAISLFSVPYIAVANDVEPRNEKRKIWIGWRMAFFNLGSFVGLVVPAYFLTRKFTIPTVVDPSWAYKEAVNVLLVIMLVCSFVSVFAVYFRRPAADTRLLKNDGHEHVKLFDLVRDRKFLRMIISYFVVNCGVGLNSALALYYYKDYLGFSEQQTQTILLGFLLMFTLSIPLWIFLVRYYDKRWLIIWGALLMGLFTVVSFPHFRGVSFETIFFLVSGVAGLLVGVAVILEIYLSDFLKEKEDLTGQNVAGQYLGIWKMSSKISRAVAISLAGPILELAGNTQTLADYFGWGVGLFFVLAGVVMCLPVQGDDRAVAAASSSEIA